jgi:CcmD family protein
MISDPTRALEYLGFALVAIWLLLALYVVVLARRLRRAEREADRLRREAEALERD